MRNLFFLKLWLVALMGIVSIDSFAQANYELVIEMRDGTKYVAPIAGALGYDYRDVAISIGLLADAGIKGSWH